MEGTKEINGLLSCFSLLEILGAIGVEGFFPISRGKERNSAGKKHNKNKNEKFLLFSRLIKDNFLPSAP